MQKISIVVAAIQAAASAFASRQERTCTGRKTDTPLAFYLFKVYNRSIIEYITETSEEPLPAGVFAHNQTTVGNQWKLLNGRGSGRRFKA